MPGFSLSSLFLRAFLAGILQGAQAAVPAGTLGHCDIGTSAPPASFPLSGPGVGLPRGLSLLLLSVPVTPRSSGIRVLEFVGITVALVGFTPQNF